MSGRAQRLPANFPVVLRQGPTMFPATICNISVGGGCIVSATSMTKGQTPSGLCSGANPRHCDVVHRQYGWSAI